MSHTPNPEHQDTTTDGAEYETNQSVPQSDQEEAQYQSQVRELSFFGRMGHRVRGYRDFWVENSAPRDEDHPIEEGTLAHRLVATTKAKIITLTVSAAIGAGSVALWAWWAF